MRAALTDVKADLIATLRFLTTAEGGRIVACPGDHLSAVFTIGARNFDVRVQLAGKRIRPGETSVVSMNFLDPDLARDTVEAGQEFTLRDWRIIAEGTVERTDFRSI